MSNNPPTRFESLDNPYVDQEINHGTSAPNCQPKHTKREQEQAAAAAAAEEEAVVVADDDISLHNNSSHRGSSAGSGGGGGGEGREDSERSAGTAKSKNGKNKGSSKMNKEEKDDKKMGYIQMARMGYQELVNAIIRPPRADYKEESLGPPAFSFCNRRFTRTDFALNTKRGLALQCSHWEPVERTADRIPVVIYMHGNSSARVEVLPQLSYLLSLGLAVFSFDFAGSGKSDGEYVSLGYYEREDLMCAIAHLRATNVVSTIALWGRSMGASTALMHGDRDPSIACMILDSPFSDLTTLAEEMCEKGKEQGIHVPGFVVSVAMRLIRGSVKKQAGVDIRDISPIQHADKCFIPALFVAGEHDDFINKRHSEQIHACYAGDKNMIVVEGDHNSPRPKFMFDSACIFLQTCLQIPQSWALEVHPGMNLMAPPWFYPGNDSLYGVGVGAGITSPTRNVRRVATNSNSGTGGGGGGGGGGAGVVSIPTESATSSSSAANNTTTTRDPSMMASSYASDEMGMTAERQKEIQSSLFKMLGQQDEDDDENTG